MLVDATRLLRILTPATATVSLALLCVALTTNEWLHTEEKMPNSNYSGPGDNEYVSKFTVSGLWRLCFTEPGHFHMHCINIEYFPHEEYSPDPRDSTMAIPYAVTRAAAFYFVSTIMLFCGEIFCLLGHFIRKRKIFTFTSGCIFIIAGLVMLGGLVIYISTFKTEIGRKLQPQSTFQPPLFTYSYGFSFLLVVSGFMSSELAGTFAIFLYINLEQKEFPKKDDRRRFRSDLLPLDSDHIPSCRRHHRQQQQQRRNTRSRNEAPRTSSSATGGGVVNPSMPLSESMRDLSFCNFPPFSRDPTCNTMSTTADINRDFSYETLRRTTPV